MGRRKHPRCVKCGKTTELIGYDGIIDKDIYGCKTPKKCGYKEYELKSIEQW